LTAVKVEKYEECLVRLRKGTGKRCTGEGLIKVEKIEKKQ
jgi:hypothetical protein